MIAPGEFSSLIALRAKLGELEALDAIDDAEQVRYVQPLIEFDATLSPASQFERITAITRKLNSFGRQIMIDTSNVEGVASFRGGAAGALGDLVDRLSGPEDLLDTAYPVRFIPVVRSDATNQNISLTSHLCGELSTGAAIRVRLTGASFDNVERIVQRLRIDVSKLDIIADLQYIPTSTPELADTVLTILEMFATLGPFRSTSVLSGSVPRTLKQTAAWQEPRFEELLWESVKNGGARHVRFGDYGVVHPLPSSGFRSRHVSLKYTCPAHWLYLRESTTDQDEADAEPQQEPSRAHTFRSVCRHLVDSGSYAGADFSWGDHQIALAASGQRQGLGSTSKPVAFSTSHHIAYLTARAAA